MTYENDSVDSQDRWLLDPSISILYKIGDFYGMKKKTYNIFLIDPRNRGLEIKHLSFFLSSRFTQSWQIEIVNIL